MSRASCKLSTPCLSPAPPPSRRTNPTIIVIVNGCKRDLLSSAAAGLELPQSGLTSSFIITNIIVVVINNNCKHVASLAGPRRPSPSQAALSPVKRPSPQSGDPLPSQATLSPVRRPSPSQATLSPVKPV